jgi:hypothetical protein
MPDTAKKEEYAKAVSLFLAELLRTRKISLERAAEIAQKVLHNINLIDSEAQFLKFIKELTSDFQELFQLHERVFLHIKFDERKHMEQKVREFVVRAVVTDLKLASMVLQEAIQEDPSLDKICLKFPEFKAFIERP